MKTQKGRFLLRPRVLLLTSLLVATSGYSIDVSAQGVDLLTKYPTTLTAGDTSTCTRTWQFTDADVFRLTGFSFHVGDALRVEVGSADVGIGHSVDGAVWAVIIPRTGGNLTSQPIADEEAIASVLLSFHPKVISRLFPPPTVFSDGNGSRVSQIRALAQLRVGSPACIPEPKDISLNVDTKDGQRRFFAVDTEAQTAQFFAEVGDRPVLRLRGQWPGYRRGFARAVAVAGNLAYVAAESLLVIDLSDPTHLRFLGGYDAGNGSNVSHVGLAGSFAYVVSGSVLDVVDISNPAEPTRIGRCTITGVAAAVTVAGNHAYVAYKPGFGAGLDVIDVSNPANPWHAGHLDLTSGAYDVAISSHYAYVAASDAGLLVIDISDPFNPQRVGDYVTNGDARGVAVSGNYAYVADGTNGLVVIDITNPAQPQQAGSFDSSGAYSVIVSSPYAYVTGSDGLVVIDITNPAQPQRAGGYTGGGALAMSASGYLAYVTGGSLQVIDSRDPTNPQWISGFQTVYATSAVAVSGTLACVAGLAGLQTFNVADPTQPRLLGTYQTGEVSGLAASGNYAYLASRDSSFEVIDLSNPEQPQFAGGSDEGRLSAVAVSGNYAYVGGYGIFRVIDVTNPSDPRRVGQRAVQGEPGSIAVSGSYAYVSSPMWSGLQVIDISKPASPRMISSLALSNSIPYRLALSGNQAYVADQDRGLLVIDISNPARPQVLAAYETGDSAGGVTAAGSYAYMTGASGLWVFDVANPAKPQLVGGSAAVGSSMVVSDNKVYLAAFHQGLMIFDAYQPPPRFTPLLGVDATGFRVSCQGQTGQALRLQRSQDLNTWEDWLVLPGTGSPQEVVDPTASSRRSQFYRAVVP